jgi:hypothetical protein
MSITQNKKAYDYAEDRALDTFVRQHHSSIGNKPLSWYLLAMPKLERDHHGIGRPIVAGYDELAAAGLCSRDSMRSILDKLNGKLIDAHIGRPIKHDRQATRIRRFTIDELKSRMMPTTTAATSDVAKLVGLLNRRPFAWADDPACQPLWTPKSTGRIFSTAPNVQGTPAELRLKNLLPNLATDQVLIVADYKQAEPSIIRRMLGHDFADDPYQHLADLTGTDRKTAKQKINSLAYSRSATAIVAHWPSDAQRAFKAYANMLDTYKGNLWAAKGKHRQTQTATGRIVRAKSGSKIHPGTLLCWRVQGTVADINAAACLNIIEQEPIQGWRLLMQNHDSITMAAHRHQARTITDIMRTAAEQFRLDVDVKTMDNHGALSEISYNEPEDPL